MKILSVVGARPQFIKAAPLSREIRKGNREVLVHTGQHYDYELSRIFFDQIDIPEPDYNLNVGSGGQGRQTGRMLIRLEEVLQKEKPDLVLVFGDTNSTLAGALAASKLHLPLAHVEAGLRSYNKEMPEEINRVFTDHVSDLLFCPTRTAVKNLKTEGIKKGIHLTGDVMLDACIAGAGVAEKKSRILKVLSLEPEGYYLATVHRQENTDNPDNLRRILEALNRLDKPVIFPVHPRTKKAITGIKSSSASGAGSGGRRKNASGKYRQIRFIKPVGYLDMLKLEKNAGKILTDSGGVQKEAYFFKRPCITLRKETEWVETLEGGWNVLTGTDRAKIIEQATSSFAFPKQRNVFGKGDSCRRIQDLLKTAKKD